MDDKELKERDRLIAECEDFAASMTPPSQDDLDALKGTSWDNAGDTPKLLVAAMVRGAFLAGCRSARERSGGWISVTERLPDRHVKALFLCLDRMQRVGYYDRRGCLTWEHGEMSTIGVTHWQPLPEPPKEEGS